MLDTFRQAYEIASRQAAAFRPIYTHLSDEEIWKARVQQRIEEFPLEVKDRVATWERIQEQRKYFWPWKPESTLFVDGVNSVEANLDQVLAFITADDVSLELL